MLEDALSYKNISPDFNFLDEVWKFDPKTLDIVDGITLSKYGMALAQYLIFYTYQRNLVKAEIYRISSYIERRVASECVDNADLLKKLKTKTSVQDYLVTNNDDLMKRQEILDKLHIELIYTEGIDKTISELIATIKRELTRRENELYEVRMERRG